MGTQKRPRENEIIDDEDGDCSISTEPAPKREKKTVPRILDGVFFTVENTFELKVEARCIECRKPIKGFLTSTGNFLKHYNKMHPAMKSKLGAHLASKSDVISIVSNVQPKLISFGGRPEKLPEDLINVIVDGNLSFNFARQRSLHSLLENISGRKIIMPTTKKIMSTLKERYDKMKAELCRVLEEQEFVCTTCDVWSARGKSFIGITVHYLTEKYERKSYVLAFREIVGKQSYDVLAKLIHSVFVEYGLKIVKITHMVTDGGSAFCKAFRVYAKKTDELHLEGNEDVIEIEDEDENAELPFMSDMGEYYFSNELDFNNRGISLNFDEYNESDSIEELNEIDEDIDEMELIETHETIELPPQQRCGSHLLNLVSIDFEKELKGPAKTSLVSAISKLHAVWVLVARSSEAKKMCIDITGYTLQVPCATRWNSKFDAVNKSVKVKPKINVLIQNLRKDLRSARNLQMLSANDWSVIDDYVKVTRPVACALDKLQAEKNGSLGYTIPTLSAMRHHVASQIGRTITDEFRRVMLKVIDGRFADYLQVNEKSREMALAAISLPRFKANHFLTDADQRIAREYLLDECARYSNTIQTCNNEVETIESEHDDFFVPCTSQINRRSSIENQTEAEVLRYLSDDRKNEEILDEYKSVRHVYFRYNTTLSASAVVERLFSQSLIIFTPRRNRLSPENFERSLLLKYNRELIEKQ